MIIRWSTTTDDMGQPFTELTVLGPHPDLGLTIVVQTLYDARVYTWHHMDLKFRDNSGPDVQEVEGSLDAVFLSDTPTKTRTPTTKRLILLSID